MFSKIDNYYFLHFNNILYVIAIFQGGGGQLILMVLYYNFFTFTFDLRVLFSSLFRFYQFIIYSCILLFPCLFLSLSVSLSSVRPNFEPGLPSYKFEGVIVFHLSAC
jgi:hypothetical protein